MPEDLLDLAALDLIQDEGMELFVYDDATGKRLQPGSVIKGHPSIGVGRCLDRKGISQAEAKVMLMSDLTQYHAELSKLPWYAQLDPARRRAILNMRHQLGFAGLMNFHAMITLLGKGDFANAAQMGLSSLWGKETPDRARRVMYLLASGHDATLPPTTLA